MLSGSTNWTATGLCAQSNNAILIEDEKVARRYLDYWTLLQADAAQQAAPLRTADATAPVGLALKGGAGNVRVWFSPNTTQKQKPKNPPTPPDMQDVFERIRKAKDGVLFLVFNPGLPSILSEIASVAEERKAAGKKLFVRGAISDDALSGEFSTRVYNDSILKGPNRLVTGIGGIPDHFSFWQKELAKLGHAVIHDKIVVIDPFRDSCCVITGSHNAGFKASYSNDENLIILTRAAARWPKGLRGARPRRGEPLQRRPWLVQDAERREKTSSFTDLADDDTWQISVSSPAAASWRAISSCGSPGPVERVGLPVRVRATIARAAIPGAHRSRGTWCLRYRYDQAGPTRHPHRAARRKLRTSAVRVRRGAKGWPCCARRARAPGWRSVRSTDRPRGCCTSRRMPAVTSS